MSPAKPSARFLPTLTEVVQILPVQAPAPVAISDPESPVMRRAMELLEARMDEKLHTLLETQAQIVLGALRDDMRQAVEDAVRQAMRETQ